MVKVIVQALRENVYVLFLESPTPFVYELDLWGSGVLAVGHWDEAAGLGGYLPEEPEADPRVIHYISTGTSAAPSGFPRLLGFLNLKYPVRTPTVARGPKPIQIASSRVCWLDHSIFNDRSQLCRYYHVHRRRVSAADIRPPTARQRPGSLRASLKVLEYSFPHGYHLSWP